ncbi:TetR/AcrR family transcriptional regulator [Xanthomonas floridensis]|uniref:TetR family transcriptional regulator n=1 Tax=Xanthomonas floridensis TaxID=1843580 RepID=A0A1A9ME79_9XANT|nr:TetR/AcrR family transcriptional regulator [Xanthomonas floridensis]MEA5126080.1 TetR/AcrR family transcriptional regulator [Xanthomonas floridensis]MEA5133976.1 TetR/AcrR family transcriptional regulator [Xanthomonas floridensis]OAG68834.1 TetR family transcriptional regulator [Xanthomonas floridensis]
MSSLPDAQPNAALLDATERLIYAGGIHATGMEAIVKASGVARKTLYRLYPTKDALVEAALLRRDERWMAWFEAATSHSADPVARLLSCFDALQDWFADSRFHGCAFLNAAGETGDPNHVIRLAARAHKQRLYAYLHSLVVATGRPDPDALAQQLLVLIDGAIAVALVFGGTDAATTAQHAARRLLG